MRTTGKSAAMAIVLAGALACGGTVGAAAVDAALPAGLGMTHQAHAATTGERYITIKYPSAWKKLFNVSVVGHTSGAYHVDFRPSAKSGSIREIMIWVYNTSLGKGHGKVTWKYAGTSWEGRKLKWNVKRGKARVDVEVANVPLEVWNVMHGENHYDLSKKECERLLKAFTGGKVKYSSIAKWSRSKAMKAGTTIERKVLSKKLIRNVTPK